MSSARIRGTVPGKRSWAWPRQPVERGKLAEWQIRRLSNGGADSKARGFDRDRAAAGHRIDQRFEPRIPPRQHHELRRHRLAQRGGTGRDPGAAAMTRAAADVDTDDGAPALRRSGATDDEHDVGRVGVDLRPHAAKGERLDQRVLHHSAQLQRRGFEIVGRPEVNGDPQRSGRGQTAVLAQRRQELLEERLEPHRRTGEQVPRNP